MAPSHPNNRRAALSADVLRELYIVQALTVSQVAERLGVAATTVARRFKDVDIRARRRGPIPRCWTGVGDDAIAWTADLAWVVGLIATDGNLSTDLRTVSVTSKDIDLLEAVRRCLNLNNTIAANPGGYGPTYRLQWSSRRFHGWLRSLGLTPAKSLTIGALCVPDDCFPDFLRGCIDGDGSIVTYVDRFNASKHPKYVYDRLFVSLVSASPLFLQWVQRSVFRLRTVSGHLTVRQSAGRHDIWCLRYAKRESVALLSWMYYAPHVPALGRKRERAERALAHVTWYRHSLSELHAR